MAVINALHLQHTPDQCQTKLLSVVIKPTFSTTFQASSIPIPHSFEVVDAFVHSIAEASQAQSLKHPELDEMLAMFLERSKAIRANGGTGVAFVMVCVPNFSLMQVSPFGLPDLLSGLPHNREWLDILKKIVAMGKVI